MPFKVSYDAPAAVIGGAAYVGGLGAFNQQQQELAQRERMQMRALAAQQQSQMFGAQQNAAEMAARQNMFGIELQNNNLQRQQGREWELADQGAAAYQQSEDDRRAFIQERYKSGEWKLDDAGTRKLNEIRNSMSATHSDPNLHPHERQAKLAELDGQWWGIMGNPPPRVPGEDEPTWDEMYETEMQWKEGQDGVMRQYQRVEPRGGGQPRWEVIAEGDNSAQAKAQIDQQKAQVQQEIKAEQAKLKAEADQVKMYDDKQVKLFELRNKLSTEMVPDTNKDGTVNMTPADDKIAPVAKQRLRTPEEVNAIMEPLEKSVKMPNLMPPPIPGQTPFSNIFEGAAMKLAGGEMPPEDVWPWEMPKEEMPPPQAQKVAVPDRFAPPPNHGYLPETPQSPQADPKLIALAQEAGMPVVKSDADFDALPSGTTFIAPDGTTRVKP